MSKVIKSKTARRDLKRIGRHIAFESGHRQSAVLFLEKLETRFSVIATQPRMGRLRDDLQPGLRCQPVASYLVFYQPTADGIELIRVLHAARDVEALFH